MFSIVLLIFYRNGNNKVSLSYFEKMFLSVRVRVYLFKWSLASHLRNREVTLFHLTSLRTRMEKPILDHWGKRKEKKRHFLVLRVLPKGRDE